MKDTVNTTFYLRRMRDKWEDMGEHYDCQTRFLLSYNDLDYFDTIICENDYKIILCKKLDDGNYHLKKVSDIYWSSGGYRPPPFLLSDRISKKLPLRSTRYGYIKLECIQVPSILIYNNRFFSYIQYDKPTLLSINLNFNGYILTTDDGLNYRCCNERLNKNYVKIKTL